jgi:hypothetical protein
MPRFFFHVVGGDLVVDEEGIELPDIGAARHHAIVGARSILSSEIMAGRLPLREAIEVTDDNGSSLLVLPFRQAFQVEE